MPASTALALIAALVLAVTALGLVWQATTGNVQRGRRAAISREVLGADLGERATLVQFSTEFCAPCRTARRVLAEIASGEEGVAHVEVDLTHRPDLASRFNVLQTPTVLLVDHRGEVHGRIGGLPRRDQLAEHLTRILEGRNDVRVA